MATRHVTRRYADLKEFLAEVKGTLARGGLFLTRAHVEDEPAKEITIELDVPLVGLLGPIPAQMVHADPGRGWGFRLVDVPTDVQQQIDRYSAVVEATRALVEAERPAGSAARSAAPIAGAGMHRGERGYFVPQLTGAPALTGELGDASFRDAIIQMALMKATGVMEVRTRNPDRSTLVRHGFWRDGGPVGWRADPVQDDEVLGMLLYRGNQVKKEQLDASLELMRNSPLRQGEAFMMLGVLTFGEVLAALGKQTDIVLQKVMQSKAGGWAFYPTDGLPERFVVAPLPVLPRIYKALLDAGGEMDPAEFKVATDKTQHQFVVLNEEVIARRKEFEFGDEEEKLLDLLATQPLRGRDLATRTTLGRKGTALVLWALEDLGVVEFQDDEGSDEAIERVKKRVADKEKQIAAGNPFDILDVHWTATSEEVKHGYKKIVADFAPEVRGLDKATQDQLAAIGKAIEDAYLDLRSDDRRRTRRKQFVDEPRIQSSAELLARKGEIAIERKDGRGAMVCFLKAQELMPKDERFALGVQKAKKLFRA
jgi:hypothetical protein